MGTMSLVSAQYNPKYLEAIKKFTLINDTFFDVCFDGHIEGMQLLLRIFFHRDDIIVKEVVTQKSASNLYGRSARFDVIAVDRDGKIYNVEIQRSNEGANPRRARFNNSLIDSREISKNTEYADFPEIWIIFITENDIFGRQLPMYHIERNITELNIPFKDGAHIIYVNGQYRGEDELGRLMHDFFCTDPSEMYYSELADRVDYFKNKPKGVSTMCEVMEDLMKDLKEDIRAEGRAQERDATAKKMLQFNEPIEKIVAYTNLSEEHIKELSKEL